VELQLNRARDRRNWRDENQARQSRQTRAERAAHTRPRGTTDREGKVSLRYPVVAFPEHGELTGKLIFNVVHREFSTLRIQGFDVDGLDNPIRMKRGIPLEVSGYFGRDRQLVTELVPNVSQEGARLEDWENDGNGKLRYHKLSPGGHVVQLMKAADSIGRAN
jgi:hypothetical protein